MLIQVCGIVGTFGILVAYWLSQSGRLHHLDVKLTCINLCSAFLLLIVALHTMQVGYILMELAWSAIAIQGWWKHGRPRQTPVREG